MGKAHESNKENRKHATQTPKEKRAAKRAKKHGSELLPALREHR